MRAGLFVSLCFFLGLSVRAETEMVTRVYRFPPPRWTTVTASLGPPGGSNDPFADPFGATRRPEPDVPWARKTATEDDTRAFFAKIFGIEFPEGSWIKATMRGELVVVMHNTPRQHARFRLMMYEIGEMPLNVRIHARLVAFDRNELDRREREKGGVLDDDALHALWRQGQGETLSRQSVITLSGVLAVLELGEEIVYPTRMAVSTNAAERAAGPVTYGDFETRLHGAKLGVTARAAPLDGEIRLTLSSNLTKLKGKNPDHDPALQPLTPIFASHKLSTKVTVVPGETRVVSQSTENEGDKLMVLFLAAEMLNADGTRLEPLDPAVFAPEP